MAEKKLEEIKPESCYLVSMFSSEEYNAAMLNLMKKGLQNEIKLQTEHMIKKRKSTLP
jgi:hypothetical protein